MTVPAFADWMSQTNDVTEVFLAAGQIPDLINMAGGLPEPTLWPVAEIADLAARVVHDDPAQALGYSPIAGLPALRDAIAARFSTPDLPLGRDNVLITTGGMQALDLLGKVLLEPCGQIAAQSPTYLGALDAWRPRAPAYRPMVLGANGFDPVAALRGAAFAYTVPNFSNPTGRLVGTAERAALLEAARQTGTWLVEDDPYGTLCYDDAPLPRILSLAGTGGAYDGPVIYLGTLSKELAPGLRIGWVIAAPRMIAALTTAKQGSDMCTSGLCQMIALRAFEHGLVDRIQPQVRDLYRSRRDALCAAMDRHLSGVLDWQVPRGGMFVWATARDPRLDTDGLLRVALEHGVCIAPGSVFDPLGVDRRSLRINFTLNPPDRLVEGTRRLAGAISACLAACGPSL
ncbi:2-aminoadipate transaminase [Gemmobacter megaterium]|uniref:2-aminoadipate transaminase n=1 Tax=Gemmobacter megaterium TaxID=1086013 RepID=A0A1N7KA49_9RHOB|nr:PLP-dependent aminotransferase family protein [Gemmobacter megaterium]GGE01037.1 aminotransferase [Gemmobacter megaterium]SIS58354.1 2-aminoadipate transaminase [Gemmobacter megaterium]